MERLKASFLFSFRAKVIVPVVAVMVLLITISMWVVNRRIDRQFEAEARRALATATAVFQNSQTLRAKNLLLRFRNLPNEPRYKATFRKAVSEENDPETLRQCLTELLAEQGVDVVLFTSDTQRLLASARRDPLIPLGEFESASALAVQQALSGEDKADTIRVGDQLYDVVSIPVGVSGTLIGALTFGAEVGAGVAQELSLMTHSQVALLASGRVTASTVTKHESRAQLAGLLREFIPVPGAAQPSLAVRKVELDGEHFFCSGGRFDSLSGDATLGYLLMISYEQPLLALRTTQQMLLAVGLVAVLSGALVVWFVVRRVTAPLHELTDSAEAVGRGDFSRRVTVRSQDECGVLAHVFNRMTEKLKSSREQLEHTVERLKTTQAQLVQSEKLSGIGEFVAGVTHELNNPLTSVLGFSELLQQTNSDPQQRRYLEMVHKSAQRCQKIVQALLSFARRHQPERKPACVNALVEAALEILHYQLRTGNIDVLTQLEPNLPQTMVDPHQLQQVFLNLINNARQAIEAYQPNGWIKVTTETRGLNVRVVIQDSGPGIAPENLSKLFDPFFTTKEVGKGTGLGLSLCYGIIEEHGGTITPSSRPGEGATFVIELPMTFEAATVDSAKAGTESRPVNPREGAGKRVLVIDDEEPILHLMRETLVQQGYEVDVASDGEAGLRQFGASKYDVALCDWKMPGLNGGQVYERLRSKDPEQSERMIFITGDVVSEPTRRFLEGQRRVCLPKPFTLAEFQSAIGKILTPAG